MEARGIKQYRPAVRTAKARIAIESVNSGLLESSEMCDRTFIGAVDSWWREPETDQQQLVICRDSSDGMLAERGGCRLPKSARNGKAILESACPMTQSLRDVP